MTTENRSEGLVQTGAGEKRPYVYTMQDIRSRLTGIRSTVAFVLKNTDLADYDDEMANDLRLAVKFLEQLTQSNGDRTDEHSEKDSA